MSTIRFRYEGVLYEVEVVRDGDVLTITQEGTAYRVELEPEAKPPPVPLRPRRLPRRQHPLRRPPRPRLRRRLPRPRRRRRAPACCRPP